MSRPLRVTVSGSLRRFLPEMQLAAAEFQELGVEVLSPRSFEAVGQEDGFVFLAGDDTNAAAAIQEDHFQAISRSDLLYVVCPEGYAGVSTTAEIGYAHGQGIPIYVSNQMSEAVLRPLARVAASPSDALVALLGDRHQETYDHLADDYESRASSLRPVTEAGLADLIPLLPPQARILDLGCGVGLVTETLLRYGHSLTALDLSEEMITHLRRRAPEATTLIGDYLTTSWPEPFDAIVAFAFIHLFPGPIARAVIRKIYQDLVPGGYLYIGTTVSPEATEGVEEKADYPNAPPRFRKRWDAEEFREAICAPGFQIILEAQHPDPYGKVWLDVIAQRPGD